MRGFIGTIVSTWRRRRSSKKHEIQGAIDSIEDGHIIGWSKIFGCENSINIDVIINGLNLKEDYISNIFRDDVKNAGIGNGYYGFSIAIPDEFLNNNILEIYISLAGNLENKIYESFSWNRDSNSFKKIEYIRDVSMNIDLLTENNIQGWCVDRRRIGDVFQLDVLIDGQFFVKTPNDRPRIDLKNKKISNGLGGIVVDLPLAWLDPGDHVVALRAPNGKIEKKSIKITENAKSVNRFLTARKVERLSVIIPIYNAADDVEICIRRIAEHTPEAVNILFIDDASTDPRIREILKETARHPNMRFLYNENNFGFTRTINRGLSETGDDDVIILNSDARVTPGWVEGMMLAARSGPRISTVTAMSDRAGAFSAPRIGNDNILPEGLDEIAYSRAFRRHSLGLYPSVPTGNGFCMFISRQCIDEIGPLDADVFPRGYGEENDFCMRAVRAGWRNIIDDRTYIFHDRSKSFGETRFDLIRAGREVIDSRYPEYATAIKIFSTSEKINLARFRAQAALQSCWAEPIAPPRILFVVSTQTGGTPQTNHDLMKGLSGDVDCWLFRCDSSILELSHMVKNEIRVMRTHHLDEAVDPITHRSDEYDAVVSQWLLGLDPDIVHIRHLGWHGLALPSIAKNLGKKVVVSFHDFYTLCPTVKLLDNKMKFCGGTCTEGAGKCAVELWPEGSIPDLKGRWVHVWRQRFADVLAPCDVFITTSNSARARILEHMPTVPSERFLVIPHGRDFDEFHRLAQSPVRGEPLRIMLPGTINKAKGRDIVYDLLEEDRAGMLEFHILGEIVMGERGEHPRLIQHGAYERKNFAEKARLVRPHLGAILSIWDETYCHTLTELWSIGLPAIVFDYATVAGRVRKSGAGWVMRHDDIPALYREILRVGFDQQERSRIDNALTEWQRGEGASNTISRMALSYMGVYRDVLGVAPGVSG